MSHQAGPAESPTAEARPGSAPGTSRSEEPSDARNRDFELSEVARSLRRRRKRTPVLLSVSLHAQAGTITWIGGANGAGKTTMLRVAAGMLSAESGVVRYGDLDPERDRRHYQRQVALVSAGDRGLYARITVRRQLELQARLAFIAKELRPEYVEAAIAGFGLTDLSEARTDQLSLGQRQRVRLALSLLHRPRLALFDEPANSLDEDGINLLVGAAQTIAGRGGVVLWCSPPHERSVIPSDEALLLEDGRLVPG